MPETKNKKSSKSKSTKSKTIEKQIGAGRPKKEISKEIMDKIELMASRGLTRVDIAALIDMSHETLYQREKEFPEITLAIARGKAKANASVGAQALKRAVNGASDSAIQFWLRSRAGWSTGEIEDVKRKLMEIEMKQALRAEDEDGFEFITVINAIGAIDRQKVSPKNVTPSELSPPNLEAAIEESDRSKADLDLE